MLIRTKIVKNAPLCSVQAEILHKENCYSTGLNDSVGAQKNSFSHKKDAQELTLSLAYLILSQAKNL